MKPPDRHPATTAGRSRRAVCQRTQAAMLSVALALSTTLPAGAAFAREPDQEREGAAPPERAVPDTTNDPDYEPGGETILPFDIGTTRDGGDDDTADGAPVDAEPVQDLDALAAPLDDHAAPDGGGDAPIAPAEQTSPIPSPVPTPVAPPAATIPPAADQRTAGNRHQAARSKRTPTHKGSRDRARQRPVIRVTVPATTVVPAPSTPVPPASTTTAAETSPPTKPSPGVRSGQATHTIQSGESLWTIASDLLGPDATDAEIAAETGRLYRLNRDRIGPDPDILAVGAVLRLR